jgi:hypothetical protein
VRAFVVWEPVLPTDWSSPSPAALSRLSDSRVAQFWDKNRLISHSMGEHDRRSIVWDYLAVYPSGNRAQPHSIDEIGHTEEVPRNRGAARLRLAAVPCIGNEGREQSGGDVANSGRQPERTGQLAREIADQPHASQDTERLDADEPVLR